MFNTNQPSHRPTFIGRATIENTAAQTVWFALFQTIQNSNASLSHNLLLVSYKKQNKERGGLVFLFLCQSSGPDSTHTSTRTPTPTHTHTHINAVRVRDVPAEKKKKVRRAEQRTQEQVCHILQSTT